MACNLIAFHSDPSSGLRTPSHLVSTVQENAACSPFLRLPSELRNKIYRYALPIGQWICPNENVRSGPEVKKRYALALPQVCRQIYTETAFFIYANNNFVFYETSDAAYWLRRKNQAQISVIRRIEVYKQHLCSPDDYARLGPVRNRLAHLISDIYWHSNPGCYGDIVFFERDS